MMCWHFTDFHFSCNTIFDRHFFHFAAIAAVNHHHSCDIICYISQFEFHKNLKPHSGLAIMPLHSTQRGPLESTLFPEPKQFFSSLPMNDDEIRQVIEFTKILRLYIFPFQNSFHLAFIDPTIHGFYVECTRYQRDWRYTIITSINF